MSAVIDCSREDELYVEAIEPITRGRQMNQITVDADNYADLAKRYEALLELYKVIECVPEPNMFPAQRVVYWHVLINARHAINQLPDSNSVFGHWMEELDIDRTGNPIARKVSP